MAALFAFTFRQVLLDRKIWAAVALILLPCGNALIIRFSNDDPGRIWEHYHAVMLYMVLTGSLPLVSMFFGPMLIVSEAENGTAVYLLTRPFRRATVLVARYAGTVAAISLVMIVGAIASHACSVGGVATGQLTGGTSGWQPWRDLMTYVTVIPVGVAAFVAVFALFSLVSARSLVFSGLYVVLVEFVASNLPLGARSYTVNHHLRRMMVARNPDMMEMIDGSRMEAVVRQHTEGVSSIWVLLFLIMVLMVLMSVLVTRKELLAVKVAQK